MKKFNWKKYIYKVVIVVLVIFFVGGVGLGAADILAIEGTYELYTPEKPLSPYPETDEAVIAYLNGAIAKALEVKPLTEYGISYSIDSDSVKNSAENEQINSAVKLAIDGIESKVEENFESKSADYGKSSADFLSFCGIHASDLESCEIKYNYYKCSMCESHIAPEDYAAKCPECGNENTLNERFDDVYEIIAHVKLSNSIFPKSENISGIIADGSNGYYTVKKVDGQASDCIIYARINRLTDEIYTLRYETVSEITASLGFEGAYASLGTVDVSAEATEKSEYNFTWAGISLDKSEMIVELGSSEVLKATLTCDKPTEYTVKWASDNEDILTVDDEGYLKTHKKFGDAVITASFTFNGKEYSNSCLVHVGVPAEGVDLNKGKLSLKAGESFELVAEFDPKDTTNTVCYWFTNDKSVADIDENGTVKAVGKGSTTVYVVTDDGNFYSSCNVEVTD